MTLRIGTERSFTLVEVMIAACVLALGAVLVYDAFFIALDTFNYCQDYLNVSYFANEQLCQARVNLSRIGELGDVSTYGDFTRDNKHYNWELSYGLLDEAKDKYKLFKIDLSLLGQAGRRRAKVSRSAFALFKQKP